MQDFEGQIRSLAGGTGLMTDAQFDTGTRSQPLGDCQGGRERDLDALAAYVASLNTFASSPLRNAERQPQRGRGRRTRRVRCAELRALSRRHGVHQQRRQQPEERRHDQAEQRQAPRRRLTGHRHSDAAGRLGDGAVPARRLGGDAGRSHPGPQQRQPCPTRTSRTSSHTCRRSAAQEPAAAARRAECGHGPRRVLLQQHHVVGSAVVLQRTEAVNFNWGSASPGAGVNSDKFSVRWSGHRAGAVDGHVSASAPTPMPECVCGSTASQVIDNWTAHTAATNTSGAVTLTAGTRYTIKMEYYDNGGQAIAQLRWLTPGATSYVAIPASRLYSN